MHSTLENKTVVITGGAKGIGRALALAFAGQGARIVLNYHTALPADLLPQLGDCLPVQGDIGRFEDAAALIAAAQGRFGSVDVLVNNAGITRDGLLLRMKEEDFDQVLATNLKGAFNTIRHAAPWMVKQRQGAILNITSVVGLMGNSGQANYAASKAGLIGLTKSTAKELAPRGITCNAIAPGFIETDMTASLPGPVKEQMLAAIPLKRFGAAEEVADLAVFLATSGYITGQVLQIDGGMRM